MGAAARGDAAAAVGAAAARPRRPQRADVARRGRGHLPAAVAPAEPLRRRHAEACTRRPPRFSAPTTPRVPFVHRHRRQRRGGEEHGLAHAAGAAVAVAEPPAGRSDHDRRLPAAAARARGSAGWSSARGFRRATTSARLVRFMADVKSGVPEVTRAGLFASGLRHRARRACRSSASRTSSSSKG